ncbi:MAG TPA: hypothetical protein V6D07_07445 [Trichocoleus sp.]
MNQDLTYGHFRPASALFEGATAYGVTLHTYQHESLFGLTIEESVQLNALGQIVAEEWVSTSHSHREIQLDDWIVMPNCVQGIVWLPSSSSSLGGDALTVFPESPKPRPLSAFVAGFKAAAAKRINLVRSQPGLSVWQRNYVETLLPNAAALNRRRQFIQTYASSKA